MAAIVTIVIVSLPIMSINATTFSARDIAVIPHNHILQATFPLMLSRVYENYWKWFSLKFELFFGTSYLYFSFLFDTFSRKIDFVGELPGECKRLAELHGQIHFLCR